MFVDINECNVDNGGCAFSCTNLEGINSTTGLGYQCGCNYGYQLDPNNHDCNGMCMCLYVCMHAFKHTYIRMYHCFRYS